MGHQLPSILDEGAKIGGGIGALLFGGIFAAFPILLFLMSDWTDESIPLPAYVLLAMFLAVGIGIMALGVSAFLHKVEIGIDKRDVVGLRRSIKGTRTWRDSLALHCGLFAEEEYHSGGKNRSSYTLYKVVLKHREDAHRDVELFCSRSDDQHRHETEFFAKFLGHPVLVDDGEGQYVERAVEDLDKPIGELVDEGKIDVQFNPYELPQGGRHVLEKKTDGHLLAHHYRNIGALMGRSTVLVLRSEITRVRAGQSLGSCCRRIRFCFSRCSGVCLLCVRARRVACRWQRDSGENVRI